MKARRSRRLRGLEPEVFPRFNERQRSTRIFSRRRRKRAIEALSDARNDVLLQERIGQVRYDFR